MNTKSILKSLTDIYKTSFTKRFTKGDFDHFEPLLEVLLAIDAPPTLFELNKILNYHYKNYNTREVANKLSEYFKSDIDQGPLEFHHQFFAEWLINQTKGINGILIQKSRGHQYIVDYLFHFYSERQTNLTFKELSELCMHILHGEKATVSNLKMLGSLEVSEVRDSWNRCILHGLASKRNATKIITELIKQFNSVDILDFRHWTPAMYAVKAGSYENIELFIDNGADVNRTVFMIPNQYFLIDYDMMSIAARRGYSKIAELLIKSGAKIEEADECEWKPLYWAVLMGHFEIVQLHINNGAKPDVISLHHAAVRNHTEIVRLLLNTGVRDKCLPCKPDNWSWCTMNLKRFHDCVCETALHAAVSMNNLEIAKLIIQRGNASVNCKHGSGRTPLMEAFLRKNTQIVELLISAGVDINAECKSPIPQLFHFCSLKLSTLEIGDLEIYSCNQPCDGSRVIDFSFAHGLWEMMTPFISKRKLNAFSSDNIRWIPTTVAIIYDQVDFINASYSNRIDFIPNIKTMLRYVAVCHSVETLKHLLSSGDLSKFTAVYEDGKTLLHFATLGSSKPKTEAYVTHSCAFSACVCPNMRGAEFAEEKRLETVRLLLKVLRSDINKQDKYERTALHYATVHVLLKLVELLVNTGADWSIEDQRGDTALEFALRERPIDTITFRPCRLLSDQVFRVCKSTRFDELASYLLRTAPIKKCDMRAKNLLDSLLFHELPLSLYVLFKSGLDVNCAHEGFKRYLNRTVSTHWSKHNDELLEVFKFYQINVQVACDVPFTQSELHLMAYLGTPSLQVGNLFQPSVNKSSFPLQRFLGSHPEGVEILNKCYDKEGYLAIHRAIQGTNFDAVSWFMEIGVDLSKNALALATYYYPRSLFFSLRDIHKNRIFEKLLEKMGGEEADAMSLQCNTKLIDLSPLHVAGSQGIYMLQTIHRKIPSLPLNCTNSDGIQPIYLAYLYNSTSQYISWDDKQIFQDLGMSPEIGPSIYPKLEAEYHLIYNQLYHKPQEDLRNLFNHESLFECPGIDDFLPNKTEIKDYRRLKACPTRCWPSAIEATREFSSNFRYLKIPNTLSNPFTDKFIDIANHMAELRFYLVKMFHFNSFHFISISTLEKRLWKKVTKAHSCAHSCSCFEIMHLLQETFTSEPTNVGEFIAQRMGWADTSRDGDVKYRWPFSFLLKKALRTDKAFKYLEILKSEPNEDERA